MISRRKVFVCLTGAAIAPEMPAQAQARKYIAPGDPQWLLGVKPGSRLDYLREHPDELTVGDLS